MADERIRDAMRGAAGDTSFAKPPPPVPGSDAAQRGGFVWLPHDERSQERLRSEDAKYGRFTYFTGEAGSNTPYYTASELDPRKIAETHSEVDITGRYISKADMDYQVLRRDSHLAGVDEARRVAVSGREVRVEANDPSDLALGLRDLGEAMIDDIDSFDGSIYELLLANGAGVSFSEAVYEPKSLRVPSLNLRIPGAWPQQIVSVHNRNFKFDPIKDIPFLEMQGGSYVDLFDPPYKFLYHWTNGDGAKRQRGHLYKTIWWHLIKHEAVMRWAHCLDFWGIPVPYQLLDEDKFQNRELKAEVVRQLQVAGLGNPFVGIQGDRENLDLNFTPTPSGLDARGMHGSLIGLANSEQSKIVQHETLTTEMGGVGGYNTANIHENTKAALVRMDERRLRSTVRAWMKEVFKMNMGGICAAFKCSPLDVMGALPRVYWLVENDLDAKTQLAMMLDGVGAGLHIDKRQAYRKFGWDVARRPEDAIPGKPITIADGAQTIGEAHASAGVDNPKDPTTVAGTQAGGAEERRPSDGEAASVNLTPSAQGAIIKVDEARATLGLPPLGSEDGELTINEFIAKHDAVTAEAAAATEGTSAADKTSAPPPTAPQKSAASKRPRK